MIQSIQAGKKLGKANREKMILIALVEQYLKTKKPIGSQTLQETEISDLSSATLRNYFASLEEQGFLKQQHSSGGRIPQMKAYVEYARYCEELFTKEQLKKKGKKEVSFTLPEEKEILPIIEKAAERLSTVTKAAVCITSPHFEQDTITQIRFVFIDTERVLCVVFSEFGFVHPFILTVPFHITQAILRKAERFCHSRLFHETQEELSLSEDELHKIRFLYQEAVARHFIQNSFVCDQDVWRTGFSHLLPSNNSSIEEIHSAVTLFENTRAIRGLSKETVKSNRLRFWIGEELSALTKGTPHCALIAIPYSIKGRPVGALSIIGTMAIPYKVFFQQLQDAADELSVIMSAMVMHHKLQYRMEDPTTFDANQERLALDFSAHLLLTKQP